MSIATHSLKNAKLKKFFNRTEYNFDGDRWYFPKLLQVFAILVEEKKANANKILDYLFETFDFFYMPEIFVSDVIGYDRLECCIKESPVIFKQALLSKIQEFVKQHSIIDIGSHSRKFLNDANPGIYDIQKTKIEKKIERQELIIFLKNNIFNYPSIKNFNSSDSYTTVQRSNS